MPSVFVPEISLGDSEERIVSAIHEALTTSGFFQLSGHGIAPEVIANAFETSKKLFDLSLEEVRLLPCQATEQSLNARCRSAP